MTDRADRDERPPTTARLRLERTVADEVQRLAVTMDLAFLEADRLLSEDDAEAAAAALERQRADLADAGGRLREAVSAAMVERAAEEVVADAADRLDVARGSVAGQSADVPSASLGQRLLGRAPAVVAATAAVVVGLVTLLTGPGDVPIDPAATEGDATDVAAPDLAAPDLTAPGLDPTSRIPGAPPGSAGGVLAGPTADDLGVDPAPGISPRIADLVDRILAEATSGDFDVVVRSPLLDELDGAELAAVLELIEERLDEAADTPTDTETSVPNLPPDDTPTEIPSDQTSGNDILDGDQP